MSYSSKAYKDHKAGTTGLLPSEWGIQEEDDDSGGGAGGGDDDNGKLVY